MWFNNTLNGKYWVLVSTNLFGLRKIRITEGQRYCAPGVRP
jgi:hypothetical protein